MVNRTKKHPSFWDETPLFKAIIIGIWLTAFLTIFLTWKPHIVKAHEAPPPPISKPAACENPINWNEIRTMFRQSVNVVDVSEFFRQLLAEKIRIVEKDAVNDLVPTFIEEATGGFVTSVYLNTRQEQVVSFVGITSPCRGMRVEFPIAKYKHILSLMNLRMDWDGRLYTLKAGEA